MKITKSVFRLEERKLEDVIIIDFQFDKKCWKKKERINYQDVIIDFENEDSHSYCITGLKNQMLTSRKNYVKYIATIIFIRLKKERF